MCFKDISLSTARNIVGEKKFWKVIIIIIEIYYCTTSSSSSYSKNSNLCS